MCLPETPPELTLKLIQMPEGKLRLVVWEQDQVIDILETTDADPTNQRFALNHILHLAYVKGFCQQEFRVRPKD